MFFNYHWLLPKTQSNEVFDWSSIIIGDYNWSSMQRLSLHLSKCHILGNHMSWLFFCSFFIFKCFFSSPEPKAPRWAISIPVTPASVVRRPSSVRQHFQTSTPLKPLGQLNSNFIWRLLRMGEQKFVQMFLVTWPRWPPCPYMVKTL